MKLGISNNTHAKVSGVIHGARLFKLVDADEPDSCYNDYWTARKAHDGWVGGDHANLIEISDVRDPVVLGAGDVVRVRENSTQVTVLWRRGAKANTLFATERCNSLCLMCSQPPREVDDQWRVTEMLELIPLIDKSEAHLGISGGEPTLLGEGLSDVLRKCNDELPHTRLHVLTNGRKFSSSEAAERWVSSGGDNTTWAVPLYADVPDLHDEVVVAPGAFDETLDGLYELARLGANVEIRVVLHKMTVDRLPQLAAYVYRRLPFVNHVALMGLEPMGFAKGNRDTLWIDPADYMPQLAQAVGFLANRKLAVSIYNLPLCILPSTLWPFARQSISEWKNKFADPCAPCVARDHCSGFFASANHAWRSSAIRPLTEGDISNAVA